MSDVTKTPDSLTFFTAALMLVIGAGFAVFSRIDVQQAREEGRCEGICYAQGMEGWIRDDACYCGTPVAVEQP